MTTRHLAFFGILILVCTVSYGVVANTINDESMQSYYAAWTKGDVDGVMSYFTDDIVYADVATGARSSGDFAGPWRVFALPNCPAVAPGAAENRTGRRGSRRVGPQSGAAPAAAGAAASRSPN